MRQVRLSLAGVPHGLPNLGIACASIAYARSRELYQGLYPQDGVPVLLLPTPLNGAFKQKKSAPKVVAWWLMREQVFLDTEKHVVHDVP
tara:strand:+ start:241 stop:507 length:267 start_codon:yes stop_codon:yes gene_type:complete